MFSRSRTAATETPTRRAALQQIGLGGIGLWLAGPLLPARAQTPGAELRELAERLRQASRAQVFDMAAEALRAGTTPEALLGAIFLARITDVRPVPVGNDLHAVLMIESACQLAAQMEAGPTRLTVLWALDDFKRAQEADQRQGDWRLPARPDVDFPDEAAARKELHAALAAWDPQRADRAITGLIPFHTRESLFEILWPYAGRSMVDLGHKVIFGVHTERMLARIGWEHAEPVLRSLTRGLVHYNDSTGTTTEAYERSRELSAALPAGWRGAAEDPLKSAEIRLRLRPCGSRAAQQLVADAFRDGLGPRTVWDGLRLFAAELFLRRAASGPFDHAALGPVHAVTETNAFGYIARTTRDETTQRVMVLQAAARLAELRETLKWRIGFSMAGPGFAALENAAPETRPASLPEVLEAATPPAAFAYLESSPAHQTELLAALRDLAPNKAHESHQFKYAAAVQEEVGLVHPRWRAHLLAPALPYLPPPAAGESRVLDASRQALRKAGS